MFRKLDQNLWVAEQPLRYFGLSIGTRMTVIRLSTRELVVISPIQLNQTISHQLSEIGTVQHIIAPNLYHHFFAADYKTYYPEACFWAVPGLKEKKPTLAIDKTIEHSRSGSGQGPLRSGSGQGPLWEGIEHIFLDGFRTLGPSGFDSLNECVFFHTASRTLILTDTALHFDESFPLLTQFATRVIGGYKQLSPSLLEKIATTEKAKVRKAVEKVLLWDFERVVMAHGSVIEKHGKQQFSQGYEAF
ncbi:MAG: DUF4336 domain-containing protein [Phormidesmis sp. RL_2_1]|nr:DUF4336 domain-containing protein [Phormidesmis sp. RL_2_1]